MEDFNKIKIVVESNSSILNKIEEKVEIIKDDISNLNNKVDKGSNIKDMVAELFNLKKINFFFFFFFFF
jgi:hypothetical protein